jgi:hypothetical protein
MAEELLESGQEVSESQAAPLPTISEPSGDEQPSAATVDAEALVDQLSEKVLAKLDEAIDRRLQSTKDKRLSALDGLDPEALRRFNAYVKKFGDEGEAVRQMQIDHLIESQSSPARDRGRSPVAEARDTNVILAEVKNDLGVEIAPDDPELVELAKKSYTSWDAWSKAVTKMGARRLKQATAPVSVVAETPQTAASGNSVAAAQQKLDRVLADQTARPAAIEAAMREVQEAMTRQR